MDKREIILRRYLFATILVIGLAVMGVSLWAGSALEAAGSDSQARFLPEFISNPSVLPTVLDDLEVEQVSRMVLVTNNWNAMGGRVRTQLTDLMGQLSIRNQNLVFDDIDGSDPEAVAAYKVAQMPCVILVGRDGVEITRFEPATEKDIANITAALN